MAKLKIGSGIKMEAQVVQPDYPVLPYDENATVPVIEKRVPSIEEVMELIKSTPVQHNHVPVEIDLSGLATKQEMEIAVIELCKQRDELEIKVEELQKQVNQIEDKPVQSPVVVPEVKQITHVKDVSPEVIKKCEAMVNKSQNILGARLSKLEELDRKQNRINLVFFSLAILTLLLHLI